MDIAARDLHAFPRLPLVLTALLLCLAARAEGADERLSGDMLQLSGGLLGVRSRDASIDLGRGMGSLDDPVVHGGSLRVVSIEGDVFDESWALPAASWRYLHRHGATTGYSFKGPSPLRRVRVTGGKGLRVFARGAGLPHTLGGNPAPVRVVLTLGQQQYCMSFGGTVEFTPGNRYLARNASAPDVCPLPYDQDAPWLCRPGMTNNQCFVNSLDATVVQPDLSTTFEPETGAEDHPYDCFYVYPTVDLAGPVGNHADVTDPAYVRLTLDPLLSQAARFNGLCRIFAPHYRQITFGTFGTPGAAQYLDIAYRDVLDAWRLYLKYRNGGRNVVIMGHSQGTGMTTRLMQEEMDPSPALRSRLIAALLIGGGVTVPQGGIVGGTFQNIPLCQTAEQTGCVIAYRSYAAGFAPTSDSNNIGGPDMDVACTNPAALGGSAAGALVGTYFPTHSNQPLFRVVRNLGYTTAFVKFAQLYSAQCVKDSTNHSYLQISVTPGPGDLRQSPVILTHVALSPALLGTHILDYNWTMGDLLALVQTKAAMMP
jgi:hypothetical protein